MDPSNIHDLRKRLSIAEDKLQKLIICNSEHKKEMARISQFDNVRIDFPSNQLVSLNSNVLTPELRYLAQTMYIPHVNRLVKVNSDTWRNSNSHTRDIANALGGFGAVEKVYQLPSRTTFGSNIIFTNPEARKAGFAAVKLQYKQNAPAMNYSLFKFPKLKLQVACLYKILSGLVQKKLIKSFSLNNFGASQYGEFVFPLYSFRLAYNNQATRYEDSQCIMMYKEGFEVKASKQPYNSNEFRQLENVIGDHVMQLRENEMLRNRDDSSALSKPKSPTLRDHIIPLLDSTRIEASLSRSKNIFQREENGNRDELRTSSLSPDVYNTQWPQLGQNNSPRYELDQHSDHSTSPVSTTRSRLSPTHQILQHTTPPPSVQHIVTSYPPPSLPSVKVANSPMSNPFVFVQHQRMIFAQHIGLPPMMGPAALGPLPLMESPPHSTHLTELKSVYS